MDWMFKPLGEFFTWTFDTLLVPAQNAPNYAFIGLGFVGLFFWLRMQSRYSAAAANNPDQLK